MLEPHEVLDTFANSVYKKAKGMPEEANESPRRQLLGIAIRQALLVPEAEAVLREHIAVLDQNIATFREAVSLHQAEAILEQVGYRPETAAP